MMSWQTMKAVAQKARELHIATVDVTGGAPELHPHIKEFIRTLRENGHHLMLRTNLTALLEKEDEKLIEFYGENGLELIASLPCFEREEVDCIRGDGVFNKSIEAFRRLNSAGYGVEEGLVLDLVYNPMGAFLPPPQEALERDYASHLWESYQIRFHKLFTITNMPVGSFLTDLEENGKRKEYLNLLESSFNPATLDNLMCIGQLNIGWDGRLYDCDFNQALGISTISGFAANIRDLDGRSIPERKIVTGEHCFGCTAGTGSSCGGALIA
jgi:radical SAM/Cys-rich protein